MKSISQVQPIEANEGDIMFMQIVWDVVVSSRLEILMFLSAVAGYLLIFASRVPKDVKRLKLKAKHFVNDVPSPRELAENKSPDFSNPKNFDDVDAALRRAVEAGDHRAVVKAWGALKNFDGTPSVQLSQVVESMQTLKKDAQSIVRELRAFFQKHPQQREMRVINDILATLGNRLDSDLMNLIVDSLPSLELKKDQRTYEIYLAMHATTRSFAEVQKLLLEMQEGNIELSTKASLAVIKASLQNHNFDEALRYFSELKEAWDPSTPWTVPRHIMAQLAELACKEQRLVEFSTQIEGLPVPEEAFNTMLSECIRSGDSELTRTTEALARAAQTPLPDSTYSLLIKAFASRPWRMKAIVQEVLARENTDVSSDLALTILSVCTKSADKTVADMLLERMKPTQLAVLSAFIRFYVETEQPERACDVFEQYVLPLGQSENQRRLMIDSRVERSLMSAALQCGRTSLVECLFDSSRTDVAKHVVMIRKCAAEKNLNGAMSIFNALKNGGVELNSIVYNTVLDACVKCHDLVAAEDWMQQTKEAGMVDVVSFNTLLKAHLMDGNFRKARNVMLDMKKSGLEPNRVTFNELINAAVQHGESQNDIWDTVKEMKAAGVAPNQVTCSILLKNLNARSRESDIHLTMDLIESIDEPMDEVLLSSTVEACVRIGKPDLVASKLKHLESKEKIIINGSHTGGSLIKAYGYARDIEGVWRCWKEMRSKLIKPTSITFGCMIEALVNNGDTEGAFELLHQIQKEEHHDLVNSVMYCSLLKGFAREKQLERVWDVYQEMCAKRMEMSLISFNTIIDACARSGSMEHLQKIMLDMKKNHVEPNIVTYSTIIKGHCMTGNMELAFSVLRQMKHETNLKPDEIMYNSLLDGCSHNNLFESGMQLFEEMKKEGVSPSNFTLSILVRLLSRDRKAEKAFELVRDTTQRYKFRPNVHVYTNLIQACIGSRQQARTLTILQDMVKDRVQPDSRLYAILIRAFIYIQKYEQASELLRAELGLPGALDLPGLKPCRDIDQNIISEALGSFPESLKAELIADIKKSKLRVNLDQVAYRSPKGKGKGKNSY